MEKLYYEDVCLRQFTALVERCEARGDLWEIELNRSAFYPEGGGQPGDTGTLGEAKVLDTRETPEGRIVHCCDRPLGVGSTVEGEVDWERRLDFMVQHSGEHIVSGLAHRLFGCDNVGFHMGASVTAIDFNRVLTDAELWEIESRANDIVRQDFPIEITFPSPEELAKLSYRSKKEIQGQVRIVTIPEADVCACCALHVRRTGEIGLIKLLSRQKLRQGVRVELVCGKRAYDHIRAVTEQNRAISALLSVPVTETAAAARRVYQELETLKYRCVGLENRMLEAKAESFAGQKDAVLIEEDLSGDGARKLCEALRKRGAENCYVFSGQDGDGYLYAINIAAGNEKDCSRSAVSESEFREKLKSMNAALSGRGGGRQGFAQGRVNCTKAEIEAYFQSGDRV